VTQLAAAPDGVLLVDKAEGMTSHDVVALVRRELGIKKVGHCGTLDPIATGLLLLTIGRGTKVQDLLMSEDKEYVGTLELGTTTNTQDRQGEVVETKPVPQLSDGEIRAAFENASRALFTFIATTSTESRYRKSISACYAAKVSMFALTRTTSGKRSVAARI
jgi:tRNA U55 pseudouridine synthase TruB